MKVIQIAGYKNSGKTTLATKLIESLAKQGFHVASLKHHGHGGVPTGIKDTDSDRHKSAGAMIAGVEGDGLLQLTSEKQWRFTDFLSIYELLGVDVLVVEGFKKESYPKIVAIRDDHDLHLLDELSNVQAIWVKDARPKLELAYPVFTWSEVDQLCQFVCTQLKDDRI